MTPIMPRYDIPIHPSGKVEISPFLAQLPAPSVPPNETKPNSKSRLSQINRASLEVWNTWLQENVEKDAVREHNWLDQAVDNVQGLFLSKHPKELRADAAQREQALHLAVKERLESGASASIFEALGYLSEYGEASVQERAQYYLKAQDPKTFSKLLIGGLMELSKSTSSDPQKTLQFVDEIFKVLESQGGCPRTSLSVYQLVDAISSQEDVLEETQRHLAAFEGKVGFFRSIQKEAYGINPLNVAVEIGLIGISGGVGNLAKAAYKTRSVPVMWDSPKVLAGAFAAHSLAMGGTLGSLHVTKAAITEDVNQLTPRKISKIYLKDGLMVPVTHLFGGAGKALFTESALAQHGMGLLGMSTSTQLYLKLMPEDEPMGGINESIAADVVGYGIFYTASKVVRGISEGVKLPDLYRPEFKNLHIQMTGLLMGGIPIDGGSSQAGGVKFTPEIKVINGMKFARIPAGKFRMGAEDIKDATPVQEVELSEYYMMETLVTNEQFEAYVKANMDLPYGLIGVKNGRMEVFTRYSAKDVENHPFWTFDQDGIGTPNPEFGFSILLDHADPMELKQNGSLDMQFRLVRLVPKERVLEGKFADPQQPAVKVTWYEAFGYSAWLNQQMREQGIPMRVSLPTEAQWEKAARGPEGYDYGTVIGKLSKKLANYDSEYTTLVDKYPPNGYGLRDMAGNVVQWAGDWYQDSYVGYSNKDPQGPATGFFKVQRGGSWLHDKPDYFRATFRYKFLPSLCDNNFGFRCVASPHN